jgi:hypothetical protein
MRYVSVAAGGAVDIQTFTVIKIPRYQFLLTYGVKFVLKKHIKIPYPYENYICQPLIFQQKTVAPPKIKALEHDCRASNNIRIQEAINH